MQSINIIKKHWSAFLPAAAAILTLVLLTASSTFAGSATWKASPATDDWNTAANWTPRTVPNGPADTATFASSHQTGVFITLDTEVNGIVFKPRASAFTIASEPTLTPAVTISGVGVTNNSGILQNFVINSGGAQIFFLNSATAGSLTAFTSAGTISFGGTSTAGNAAFTNNNLLKFANTSTAGDATFTNNSVLIFEDSSTARNGTFTNAGGLVIFSGIADILTPTAGNGTFTNSGNIFAKGFIIFNSGTAGNATLTNNSGAVSGEFPGETLFNPGDAGNATLIANGGLDGADGGLIVFSSAAAFRPAARRAWRFSATAILI